MAHDLTHASFFSGAGGLDLGLERAGWRTVSFSEIDPYASAVLAQRWPGVPNLGDIVSLVQSDERASGRPETRRAVRAVASREWHRASLWTGGFPCQDLSVAGKRRGMGEGTRSGLAYSFLALAERHRPRFILLENVPGLLSSHRGKDFGALLDALVQLGYGVGYRVLNARYFGVPQRRRRVFILGDSLGGRAGAERAGEVLSVGSRCRRHPPAGVEAGEGAADGIAAGTGRARTVVGTAGKRHDEDIDTLIPRVARSVRPRSGMPQGWNANLVGSSPDPRGNREADGLARRSHHRDGVAHSVRPRSMPQGWNTTFVNALDQRRGGADDNEAQAGHLILGPDGMTDDPLLPLGLDSHRFRCCGNGVVSDVAEWIGLRLATLIEAAA